MASWAKRFVEIFRPRRDDLVETEAEPDGDDIVYDVEFDEDDDLKSRRAVVPVGKRTA